MSDPEIKVLDIEAVSDPETLLEIFDDILNRNTILTRAVALVAVLLLNHMKELDSPDEDTYRGTVGLLVEFLEGVTDDTIHQAKADAMRDLLDARE